ncbi:MAG: hypothetical protein IKX13_09620, partial [Bacteroidales bacterium]|nr:hypothetical protein [Bacteroidales bacterium]
CFTDAFLTVSGRKCRVGIRKKLEQLDAMTMVIWYNMISASAIDRGNPFCYNGLSGQRSIMACPGSLAICRNAM